MKKILFLYAVSVLFLWSCSKIQDWADPKDSTPPGKITNVNIENLHGGVIITYKLPEDNDIMGVKATYSFKEGNEINAFSSALRDTIELNGFPDTQERVVNLICIDESQNESEPVSVTVNPLTPPVEIIGNSLKTYVAYGGIYITWNNEYNADISISLYATDSNENGDMKLYNTIYSDDTEGSYTFRGFDDSERKFRVQIKDRWGNYATPVETTLTPLFEEEILSRDDYNNPIWQKYGLSDGSYLWRGDAIDGSSRSWEYMIDGAVVNMSRDWYYSRKNYISNYLPDYEPADATTMPLYFTLDLGSEVSLSRHKLWMRGRNPDTSVENALKGTNRYYQQGNMKYYEIWGTKQTPKQKEDFSTIEESLAYWTDWPEVGGAGAWRNDWIKLADCEALPPSGATIPSQLTVDDLRYADEGFESEVFPEVNAEKVRYIRYVIKEVWQKGGTNIHCVELKLYGAYNK